jgi:sugar lactone lactonase YvrE
MIRRVARTNYLNCALWILLVSDILLYLCSCSSSSNPVDSGDGAGSAGYSIITTATAGYAGSTVVTNPTAGGGGIAGNAGRIAAGNGGVSGTSLAAGTGGKLLGGAGAAGTGGNGGQAGASVNCTSLLSLPITKYTQIAMPGTEDFTFDKLGFLLGVDSETNMLFRAKYDGTREDLVPNIGLVAGGFPVRGMRFLAGADSTTGDLVFADVGGGGLSKVNMQSKTKSSLATGANQPNGVAVDPNGFAYLTAADGNVWRVNTKTGQSSEFFKQAVAGVSLDGIAFSPDYKRLYIDTEMGYLSYLPIKDDGTAGDYVIMAKLSDEQTASSGGPPMLDGLTVDECGNIYVVQMSGTIWRVSPDSLETKEKVVKVITIASTDAGFPTGGPPGMGVNMFAVNFGTGVGGWKSDAIYIMNMMGNYVYEVVVGVKGAPQQHL